MNITNNVIRALLVFGTIHFLVSDPGMQIFAQANRTASQNSTFNLNIRAVSDDPNASVLAQGESFLLVAYKNKPYGAFVDHDFNYNEIPRNVLNDFIHVHIISVSDFDTEGKEEFSNKFPLFSWIVDLKELEALELDRCDVQQLGILKDLPIKHLVISNANVANLGSFIEDLGKLKTLKYLVHDNGSLSHNDVRSIHKSIPGLSVLKMKKYDKMVRKGRITQVEFKM